MKRERIDAADIPSFIGENFDNLDFSTSELKKYDMNDAVSTLVIFIMLKLGLGALSVDVS